MVDMTQTLDMSGRVAFVTGAASGLGRATALRLGAAGAKLCLVDVDPDGLEDVASTLIARSNGVFVKKADLTSPTQCAHTVNAAVEHFGRLDALCNVAGMVKFANSHTMPREDWERIIALNLSAPFFLSQVAIPHLLQNNGAIVNVASSAAFIGEAYAAAYCASKAGLVNLTKSMAMEYMRKPIRINAVAPGGMSTNIAKDLTIPDGAEPDLIKRFVGFRGLVEVDDVADLIALLASPAGRSYHGACLTIDAGITAG
jgi:NAD(P)-dependent dehydrogenase (short-subunit alcohol dehydrogenase family)